MRVKTVFFAGVAALALQCIGAQAQDFQPSDDLFQARFKASSTGAGDKANRAKIDENSLIGRVVGTDDRTARKQYTLVYNASADRLQVVSNADGALAGDVLLFGGGAVDASSRQGERLAFVYLPSVGEPIGTAYFTERATSSKNNNTLGNARIVARLQFYLPADVDFALNAASNRSNADQNTAAFYSLRALAQDVASDARIFTGQLTVSKRFAATPVRNPQNSDNPGNSGGETIISRDISFVRQAIQLNLAEIRMGNLFVQKGQSGAVRGYGQMLVNDHTAALQELTDLASAKNISVPTTLTSTDNGVVQRLSSLNDAAFDAYARQSAIAAHERAIDLHEAEAKNGRDNDVRAFARASLPPLRNHLALAQQLPASALTSTNDENQTTAGNGSNTLGGLTGFTGTTSMGGSPIIIGSTTGSTFGSSRFGSGDSIGSIGFNNISGGNLVFGSSRFGNVGALGYNNIGSSLTTGGIGTSTAIGAFGTTTGLTTDTSTTALPIGGSTGQISTGTPVIDTSLTTTLPP